MLLFFEQLCICSEVWDGIDSVVPKLQVELMEMQVELMEVQPHLVLCYKYKS